MDGAEMGGSGLEDEADDVERAARAFLTASRALLGISVRSVAAASVSLTVPQHRLLVLVSADGPRRVGVLAEDLGVNQSNASRLVDRLARQGLVRRTRGVADGRVVVVELTDAGREVLTEVNTHRLRALVAVLREMPGETRSRAADAMRHFNEAAHEAEALVPPT